MRVGDLELVVLMSLRRHGTSYGKMILVDIAAYRGARAQRSSRIYMVLKRLLAKDLIRAALITPRAPRLTPAAPRKYYELTDAAHLVLRDHGLA